ncbi:MFS transporter [Sphaerisporangium aureirubrum]|uniref:MFS transporter n=1 Tax=Sphaerisporangium aureirubrum TaxID=1544736 RepID=A0ABW1NEU9_9ACTN
MSRALRTARYGVILTFVLAGLVCGTYTVRIPALTDKLGISEASMGVVLLAWGLGALVAMQAMRGVMARVGSGAVLRIGAPLCAVSLLAVAAAPSYPLVVAASALFGMFFGTVDVAMNAQGATVERAYGRPLMNGMHAGWCVGAMSAGVLGTVAISFGMSFTANLALVAAAAIPASFLLSRTYLPDLAAAPSAEEGRRRLPPVVYLLGVIAFAAFMVEGAVADWNGLYLRDTIGAPEAVAAIGYPIFEAGMLVSRLAGDRLRSRVGARRLIMASGLATAAAFAVVLTTSSIVIAIAGMVLIGLSVATISPMALSLAGAATRTPGPAIAQTGAMGYAGLLLGPVVIGMLTHTTSLRTALTITIALGLATALTAHFLPTPSPRPTSSLRRTRLRRPTDHGTPAPQPTGVTASRSTGVLTPKALVLPTPKALGTGTSPVTSAVTARVLSAGTLQATGAGTPQPISAGTSQPTGAGTAGVGGVPTPRPGSAKRGHALAGACSVGAGSAGRGTANTAASYGAHPASGASGPRHH